MNYTILGIVIGSSALIVCLLISIIKSINNARNEKVLTHSQLLKELKELNDNTPFNNEVKDYYKISHSFDTKRKYDNASPSSYLRAHIYNNLSFYKMLVESINYNKNLNETYLEKYNSLKSSATEELAKTIKISFNSFIKREQKFFKKQQLKPAIDLEIKSKISYTSPQGRNHYSDSDFFYMQEIEQMIEFADIEKARKESIEHKKKMQRLKLTDSMRYDVMMRDGFKCVLCGATAKDGTILHVDHILPIAKGGLTEPDNLRTLCDRCNLGKRDKIEEVKEN